ncbi:mannose-1-phosphate guanyltransferase [Comamonas aquatica DA1877]|uniref:mannose-1-phosphate guanylyltransferase n=1 Tax=Comamonas aquatica DA1877 TaxID=1457173 RepID=A0A014NKN6_9BURK|nr:mannose-1-phosphate guanylyltransferase/mannose-6-phosphate isomerase [Comamonas aquatica]EXU80028.1 mannose-1-phosphate guanyltransferase [Comamonas aquatica DA1877]
MQVIPVIMAGGSGTRLWPLSRVQYPKQFLPLAPGGQTLLQATVQRLAGLDVASPLLICNEEHRFLAAEQLRAIGVEGARILLEPAGRNTAPAIALAALQASKLPAADDAVLLVLAADHFIPDVAAFQRCVHAALPLAQAGKLVAYGVVPTHAETGYGYIEQGAASGAGFVISRFVEKPDALAAQGYLESGRFLWNSGMFMFKARRYIQELERFAPDMLKACQAAIAGAHEDLTFVRVDKASFEACPSDSIDYVVMEKTADAVVVPLGAGWTDVGSWSALWDVSPKDDAGNAVQGDAILQDSVGTYVHASNRLVATVGVQNLVVVETKDAVLVASKDRVQDVKKVVEQLKADSRSEHYNHREVYRPWGIYDSIEKGTRYQVKRITVKPGAKLSVQMHHHRAEHWIVVSGTAQISNGDKTYLLTENQSTYIPVGQVHALENPGKIPLELIEVQSGSYLGEDDIVRLEDRYGRVG